MSLFPSSFPHHRLNAYTEAKAAMREIIRISDQIPRGHRPIADQLKRASTSVVANIAEGANRSGAAERRQRFVVARGEAGEAEAWLEILAELGIGEERELADAAHKLDRVAAMLAGLIQKANG